MTTAGPRVAWWPLGQYIGPISSAGPRVVGERTEDVVIGELCGLSSRTIVRYKTEGVPVTRADEIACRLGTHPALIWPEWFELDADVAV